MWLNLSQRLDRIELSLNANTNAEILLSRHTSQDNLIRRYRIFACISAVFSIISLLWLHRGIVPGPLSSVIPIAMAIYFLCASGMDLWLMCGIKSINISTMTIGEVSRLALHYRRLHHICMMILIPACVIILGMFMYSAIDEPYMLISLAAGALLGLAIGITQYLKFMRDYKSFG